MCAIFKLSTRCGVAYFQICSLFSSLITTIINLLFMWTLMAHLHKKAKTGIDSPAHEVKLGKKCNSVSRFLRFRRNRHVAAFAIVFLLFSCFKVSRSQFSLLNKEQSDFCFANPRTCGVTQREGRTFWSELYFLTSSQQYLVYFVSIFGKKSSNNKGLLALFLESFWANISYSCEWYMENP